MSWEEVRGRDCRRKEEVPGSQSRWEEIKGSMRRWWRRSMSSKVPRSRVPKDQNISKSHSNTNLTLKKVHLVLFIFYEIIFHVVYKKFI